MNLTVWQFLPTGPTAYGDSPYQPLSTFAGNELLIDTATLIRTGLLTSNEADGLLRLPADSVDYGALIPPKKRFCSARPALLRQASRPEKRLRRVSRRERRDWLHDYALFES